MVDRLATLMCGMYLLAVMTASCGDDPILVPPVVNPPDTLEGRVEVWKSNNSGSMKLFREVDSLPFEDPDRYDVDITLDVERTMQTIEGFGAALTGSSAYVINRHLSSAKRTELLTDLFDSKSGIGISYIRLVIGASDFSLSSYTYNDQPLGEEDPNQDDFDLSIEDEDLVPVLQEILTINPKLNIMASPWSAPAWMKTNESLVAGGFLKEEYRESYAKYFVRYLQEMEERGIPIKAVTVQNEPLYAAPSYPSMEMSAEEQLIFIRDYLGPAFRAAGIDTKVILYDHNWDNTDFALEILSDPEIAQYLDGTAYHCYGGDVSAMSDVHEAYPNTGLYFTECSGGGWAPDYGDAMEWNVENLFVGAIRNWSKTVLLWNLALDQNAGPQNGGCQNCRGVVTVSSGNGSVAQNVEYVLIGHMAKFVAPGAKRVASNETRGNGVSQVAFVSEGGTRTLVAFNHTSTSQILRIVDASNVFSYEIEPGMLATFNWEPE